MRKLFIGFISLAVAFGVFLLYSRIDKTPPIDSGPADDFITSLDDSNAADFNNIGKIGNTGIGRSRKVRYITRNEKTGEIEGEFGFETLVSDEGGVWELEKPYRNIYQPGFICYMTADKGRAQVETIADEPVPRDATFSENVVIHIEPKDSGEIKESYIFLDNLDFVSDKSLLSTVGPVKFVSEDTLLLGTGMELIYDGDLERLEYFSIIDLESLRFKTLRTTLNAQPRADRQPERLVTINNEDQIKTVSITEEFVATDDSHEPEFEQSEVEQKENYTCVFSKNVLIDTPEQLIFAEKEVRIRDIFWSEYERNIDGTASETPSEIQHEDDIINSVDLSESNEPDMTFTDIEPNEPDASSEDYIDVVITCDGGFVVTPKDSEIATEDIEETIKDTSSEIIRPEKIDDDSERTTLFTRRISYTTLEDDTIVTGPTELTIYVEDTNSIDPNKETFPVTVISQGGARFSKAANQVVFDVNCLCTIPQRDLSIEKNATVSSQRLTVQFPGNNLESTSKLSDIVALGPAEMIFYIEDSNKQTTENPTPVTINAQKQILYLSKSEQIIFEGDCLCTIPQEDLGEEYDFKLRSPMLTAGLPEAETGQSFALADITATGPVGLDFYVQDSNSSTVSDEPLPVKVTAQRQARFLSSSNQIVLEGSCRSSTLREDPNYIQEFKLLSEIMTVNLPEDTGTQTSTSLTGFERLTANGGQVTLSVLKKARANIVSAQNPDSEKILAWTKLICKEIDYDMIQQHFLASGPGEVTLSDSEIKDLNEQNGRSISEKQWWAIVRDFDSLKYLPNDNRVIASAKPGQILSIDYTSIENGEYGSVIIANAGHADIKLMETSEGKAELSRLIASGGIDYKDDGKRFFGSTLFYDHEKSTIIVEGDELHPVYFNGSLFDRIEYNLKTGDVKTQILGGGM